MIIICKKPHVREADVESSVILDDGCIHFFNESATEIYDHLLLETSLELSDLILWLKEKYADQWDECEAVILADMFEFLYQLNEKRLVNFEL